MGVLRPEERELIEHTLGLNRSSSMFRNHSCADDGHTDMPIIKSLVQLGFMRESHKINEGRDTIFTVTEAGKAALDKKF